MSRLTIDEIGSSRLAAVSVTPQPAGDLATGMGVLHVGTWREVLTINRDAGQVYVVFSPDGAGRREAMTYTVGEPVWMLPAWAILHDAALADTEGPDANTAHDADCRCCP